MKKCDVIIPVYNAPDYTKMCVYALFKNTEMDTINQIYLLNDNSNEETRILLENLSKKYSKKVTLINNKENLGFIKNVNQGLEISKSKYVLLLNTDCFIGHHTIEKMMNQMEKDNKIGLMCPLCSNAANLTLPMFPGFNYMMMDKLLENKFLGMNFDACTVVGNCLMISQECIKKVGYLDEIYGMGYGDETDYQFKAMSKGFTAKVAIDSYVFHKAEMSFNTTNQSRSERLIKNREIFFSRWENEYNEALKEYEKNDPIKYVTKNISKSDSQANYDFLFVMDGIGNGVGGAAVVVNLVNYLSILGLNVGLLSLNSNKYQGIMNFDVLTMKDIKNIRSKYVVSTIFRSVFFTKKLAEEINAQVIYLSQGYEFLFENGKFYGEVEMSFKLVDYVITISDYLKNEYKELFDIDAIKIENGIDLDQLTGQVSSHNRKSITMVIRPESLKAGCFMQDIIKHLTLELNNIDINLLINDDISICVNNNPSITINQYKGPISSTDMINLLRKTDILIDTSLSEGFGLVPLEAMAVGAVPIVANAFGNLTYCQNGKNSIVINDVNNTHSYVENVKYLLENEKILKEYQKQALKTAKEYDFDITIEKYYQAFQKIVSGEYKKIQQTITLQEMDKLANYIYSSEKFQAKVEEAKKNLENPNNVQKEQSRLQKFAIIFREFIKSNLYLLKLFIKTILKNDFKI